MASFDDLTHGLIKDGHPELAVNALRKFDAVLPDINPNFSAAQSKISLADTSYKLNERKLGDKLMASVEGYLTDQLNYNYYLLQKHADEVDARNVQYSLSFLNGMAGITHDNHQDELNGKLLAEVNDYESKFSSIIRR